MSFNEAVDTIVQEAIQQYASTGIENSPQSLSILIHASEMTDSLLMPPIILNIGIINACGYTYAILLGWFTWQLPADNLSDVLSSLLSLDEFLAEQYEDTEEEDDDDEQQ